MAWTIRFTARAAKAVRKLDPEIRRRVQLAVATLREEPERGKPLQLTLKGLRWWRTGDFRIVYRLEAGRVRSSGDRTGPSQGRIHASARSPVGKGGDR